MHPEYYAIFKFTFKVVGGPSLNLTFHKVLGHAQNIDKFIARM